MSAQNPRRLTVESSAEPLSAAPDAAEPLRQLVAVMRPASTIFMVHAPAGASDAWPTSRLAELVEIALGRACPDPAEIAVVSAGGQTLAAILTPHNDTPLDAVAVHTIVLGMRQGLADLLPETGREYSADLVVAPVAPVPSITELQDNLAALNELLEALLTNAFNVHFQPIIHFASGRVFGYEALIRVPQSGVMKKPGMFFRAADRARLVSWMDVNCQERCFEEAARAGIRDYLFANMDAEGLSHVQSSGYDLVARARQRGISPARVVLEITERQAVEDFPRLAPFIEELRDAGFKIAVDDAGAGYSSLHTIAELRPDFVKIDRSLVRSLQDNGPRRALLSTLARFASQVGAAVIAEGCETRDELAAVIECGVTHGQGYVLARPNESQKGMRREIREFIADRTAHRTRRILGSSYTIERMARRGVTLPPDAPGSEAAHKFRKFPDMESIAVVSADGHVEGLLTRTSWERSGGTDEPEAPIECWMDRRPLVVEADTPLEAAAIRTTYRAGAQFQDDLIVARGGAYIGVVPMKALLEAVVTHKVNGPRYEHPVTGLVNMASIELTCNEEIAAGRPVSMALVEVAYFRPFNQHYGLVAGDDLLRATAGLLREAVGQNGTAAHLHGNDFLLVLPQNALEETCRRLVDQYSAVVHSFYTTDERKQGFIQTVDPAGQARRVPLVTLRIFGLSGATREITTFSQGYRFLTAMRQSARRAGPPATSGSVHLQ